MASSAPYITSNDYFSGQWRKNGAFAKITKNASGTYMKGLDLAGVHLRPKGVFPSRVRHEGAVLAPFYLPNYWTDSGFQEGFIASGMNLLNIL